MILSDEGIKRALESGAIPPPHEWNGACRVSDEEKPAGQEDPEPEGVVEVEVKPGDKRRVVGVDVLVAERKRVAAKTEERFKPELEAAKAHAEENARLKADLAAIQPFVQKLQQRPELMKVDEPDEIKSVTDEEAERTARQYELYTANGLDLPRAKRIIADRRKEMATVAEETAKKVVQPYAKSSAKQAATQTYVWAASQKGPDGRPLADPKILADIWAYAMDENPEYAANPQNASALLLVAIGQGVVTGKQPPSAPTQDPLMTEPAGGGHGAYQITPLERRMAQNAGLSEAEWTKRAKDFQPDAVNVLGD